MKQWMSRAVVGALAGGLYAAAPVNFLIITADDMNFDSVGCYGCPLEGVTPAIDTLASQGIRFEHAHVASTACYPSRSAISTGRRGHRSGGEGFFYLRFPNVPTVQQLLHDAGYRVGILGKVKHSTPYEDTPWDMAKEMGRDTSEFVRETELFVDEAKAAGKPFYLIVNSHDPHRPYVKIDKAREGRGDEPSRYFTPEEIPIHPTVPDHPEVRHEQAEYFSSVRRFDDVVRGVVQVLEERKMTRNTVIVLLSDHGMAVPSAKSNCYVQSTRTPLIVRWDGTIKPGQVDREHMVSSMDLLPTMLELAALPNPGGMDGRSLVPLLKGKAQENRDHIFTQYYMKIGAPNYQMRGLQTPRFLYLFNPWYNGKPVYSSSSMGGSCFRAMVQLGKTDPEWAARAEYLLTRAPEEFFDLSTDPFCMNNLIGDPKYRSRIDGFRMKMATHLVASEDPMEEVFTVWRENESVEGLVSTYAAMWEKHDLPGRVASQPVNRSKWETPFGEEPSKSRRTKSTRNRNRKQTESKESP